MEQYNLDFGNDYNEKVPLILISVHEKIHFKILKGEKKYEYRKQYFDKPAHAFIYVTGSVQSICAFSVLDKPIIGDVNRMITINQKDFLPNKEGISNYFKGKEKCYAIPIINYKEIAKISLDFLRNKFGKFYPPQSYIYLEKKPELLHYLLEIKNNYLM